MDNNTANKEIKRMMGMNCIKEWQLAKEIGVCSETISRWLRVEMNNEKKEKVIKAINRMCCENDSEYKEAYQRGREDAIDDAKDFIHKAIAHDGRNGWSVEIWEHYIMVCLEQIKEEKK